MSALISPASRRHFLVASGHALTACAAASSLGVAFAQTATPLRIGMVMAKQGPLGRQGEEQALGARIAFDALGGKVLGRPAELIWLDEPSPQAAVQNAVRLIEEQKVSALIGGLSSANTLAMGAVAARHKVPFIGTNGAAREITGKDCNPYMFRMAPSVPVYARAMAPHLLQKGKRWYFLVASFAFGDDVYEAFSEQLKAAGGTVVGLDRVPADTTDLSSYMLKVRAAKPDVLVSGLANVGPILKALKELGLKDKITLAGPSVSDTDLWSVAQDELSGIYGKTWYYNDPDNTPEEQAFVRDFQKAHGRPPSDRTAFGWLGMRMLLAAMDKAQSPEPGQIARALVQVRMQDGTLPMSFRAWDHQLLRRVVIAQAKAKASDRWDALGVVRSRPADEAALNAMHGNEAQVGCKMGDF